MLVRNNERLYFSQKLRIKIVISEPQWSLDYYVRISCVKKTNLSKFRKV